MKGLAGHMPDRIKRLVIGGSRRLGWEVSRHGIVRGSAAQGGYLPCPSNRYLTLAPWLADDVQRRYERIDPLTTVSPDRCYMLEMLARHCAGLGHDFAECGVLRGGTAVLLAEVLRERASSKPRLHLFDTFEGMPAAAERDPSGHQAGDFGATSLSRVRSELGPYPNVVFHPGTIPQTLNAVEGQRFSFVHVDVDLYESTRDCLRFFYPRLVPGGMLVCDDYGFPLYERSARLAVDEFFERRPEDVIVLRSGQCFVIKPLPSERPHAEQTESDRATTPVPTP